MFANKEGPRFLCLGRDMPLLQTRLMVLATRYSSVATLDMEQFLGLPRDHCFDLILVCHTVPKDECELVAQVARGRWPDVKKLALLAKRSECERIADGTVKGLDGPRALLEKISGLVESS